MTTDAGKTTVLAADQAAIARAAAVLRAGGLVGLPTETVYGLAADATSDAAVAGIYAAKARPAFNPLIAHVPSRASAEAHGVLDAAALRLAAAFWPGPLTLVVPAREDTPVCLLARAGLPSVALRVPAHPVALALLEACGRPVAAPSANRSGRISPTTAAHVVEELDGAVAVVLDAGPCSVGVESTIVACLGEEPVLLRPGGVPRATLEAVLGHPLAGPEAVHTPGKLLSPGLMLSHYAPVAPVRLAAEHVASGEALLTFANRQVSGHPLATLDLSSTGNLREAAANLFGYLRRLDALAPAAIAVVAVPEHGLGEAINDRLRRAAALR
jgi:L-threonylcarbamoyladenylate synthase